MLKFCDVTLSRGPKRLLDKASVTLYQKQKIGLVGLNGCGKSTLLGLILKEIHADTGECFINAKLRISHLSQQLPDTQETALDFVLGGDEEYLSLQQRIAIAEQEDNNTEVLACHERLMQTAGYSKPAQAASIMAGLGFSTEGQQQAVNSFSGGWRMRLSLARCLMKPADLLLLDEPTNHLDMEAIFWLEKWLKQTSSAIIIISHDREFLDAIVTHILHLEHQNLKLYSGNYSTFEETRVQQLSLQQSMFEKQQKKITEMMSFINRFRAKASKAKQAQSRMNAIDKMELIAQAQFDSPFSFNFYPCSRVTNPLIQCDQVTAGYTQEQPILKKINLTLNGGDRIALLGPNGEGKSTLIKTLTKHLSPLEGRVHHTTHLKIGYYAQHQLEELDEQLSPIQTIQALSSEATEQTIRNYLGGFNFIGDMATAAIHHFSGGEKARLALAKLVWLKPNLLLLDEPTNHLDLNMRAAIEIALQSFEGALILISHDRHLLKTSVDSFYLVYGQQVQPFKGDLGDYYRWLENKELFKTIESLPKNQPYKEKKALQNRLKKLEQNIEDYQQQRSKLELNLSDLSLYEEKEQHRLNQLLNQQTLLEKNLSDAEREWLELIEQLE